MGRWRLDLFRYVDRDEEHCEHNQDLGACGQYVVC